MNFRFSTATAALGCVLLASCYPYDESRDRKTHPKPPQKTVTTVEQQRIQEQRDKLKAEEDLKKKEAVANTPPNPTVTPAAPDTTLPQQTKPPVQDKPRTDYPVANKVPGKEGYVFSPYNNKLVNVVDIPPGTLVQDPTYNGDGKGYFRVP